MGIEADTLRRLFEPFMQADMALDRSRGGLGLGLALVKGLVEMHGGQVTARSEGAGRGAEFVVELPLATETSPAIAAGRREPAVRSRRVLVIEDNLDAGDTLKTMLELEGHVVHLAHDGRGGVAAAKAFRPDVVLCDIGLPGMDGFAVARAFRADPALRGVGLVALSGYALQEDVQRARQAGFDKHLAKPATPEAIQEVFEEIPLAASPRDATAGLP
jgi:two-component system CheB/CheR fusion protein